jgi:outer membrane immunogenic protein
MKTLTLALAGTALVGALATSAVAGDCSFSGFYLGAQLGAGTTNTEVKGTTDVVGTDVAEKSKLAGTGAVGGLHVGYGKHFPNRFYMGLEAYGNLSGNKETHTTGDNNRKVERNNAFGAKLRPGFVFGNALVYGVVGVESASFKYSASNNAAANTGSNNGRRTGIPVGLGTAFHATDHVILGVEATHTFYNSRTVTLSNAGGSLKFQSQATDFFARASYKW